MAYSSHHKDGACGTSGNIQLGLRDDLSVNNQDQNSTKFILEENSTAEEFEDPIDEGSKIHRTRFTAFQKFALEEAFASCQYVRSHDCQALAERLGLSVKTVQVWFRNKRFKIRKSARQERQRQRLQPSTSNCCFPSTKFHEVDGRSASSPPYMLVDSRIPYVMYSPPAFSYTDDYLLPRPDYSPFSAVTSAQSRYMYRRSHPYQ